MDKKTTEKLQEVIKRMDKSLRPYALFVNPRDKDMIDAVREEFPALMAAYVVILTPSIEEGKMAIVEREEMESWIYAEPPKE